ncbi:transmembrane protein 128-like [Pomacea canaliculata]|uniref:transmembrane protein 128-like n=1 Tax=Pomacea canaliculata TaxID=400727 RepID=UPI000D73CCF3|nr:transmembrane protein 128-like [Pomacea canaliculata]
MAARISDEEATRRRIQHRLADRYLNVLENEEEEDRKQDHSKNNNDNQQIPKRHVSAFSVQNVLWLIASIAVFHFTDFYLVLLYDSRIDRMWFNVGAGLITVTLAIAAFLIVWLSMVKKVSSDDWESTYPAAIPIATASFIAGSCCVIKSLWPVWGILTPPILVTLFMGVVVVIAMFG